MGASCATFARSTGPAILPPSAAVSPSAKATGSSVTAAGRFARTVSGPSLDELSFVWELGEIAAGGGDIRPRVLGLD